MGPRRPGEDQAEPGGKGYLLYSAADVGARHDRVKNAPATPIDEFTDERGEWIYLGAVTVRSGKGRYPFSFDSLERLRVEGCPRLGGRKLTSTVREFRTNPDRFQLYPRIYLLKSELDAIAAAPAGPEDAWLTLKAAAALAKERGCKIAFSAGFIERYIAKPHPLIGRRIKGEWRNVPRGACARGFAWSAGPTWRS